MTYDSGSFKNVHLFRNLNFYPGFRVRTVPPVSVRVRVKVSYSFKVLCFEFD